MALPWQLDPTRNEYYYYSVAENAYIFQNGRKIPLHPLSPQSAERSSKTSSQPKPTEPQTSPVKLHSGQVSVPFIGDDENNVESNSKSTFILPAERLTRLGLLNPQPNVGFAIGSKSTSEKDRVSGAVSAGRFPEYKTRRPGNKFFKVGKVFKALWPEVQGQPNQPITITPEYKFSEGIVTKIRWFVVVKEGYSYSTCVSIKSYYGRGLAGLGDLKWQYAIVYSGKSASTPGLDELTKPGEIGMATPIRITPRRRGDKLDPKSRVDFGRVYTVEHNIKALDFGEVHEDHLALFLSQWSRIYLSNSSSKLILPNTEEASESESEGDDDKLEASIVRDKEPVKRLGSEQNVMDKNLRHALQIKDEKIRELETKAIDLRIIVESLERKTKDQRDKVAELKALVLTLKVELEKSSASLAAVDTPAQLGVQVAEQNALLLTLQKSLEVATGGRREEERKNEEQALLIQQLRAELHERVGMPRQWPHQQSITGRIHKEGKSSVTSGTSLSKFSHLGSVFSGAASRLSGETGATSASGGMEHTEKRFVGLNNRVLEVGGAPLELDSVAGSTEAGENEEFEEDSDESTSSESSAESEPSTIDLPFAFPIFSPTEERLIDPQRWSSRLAELETTIVDSSSARDIIRNPSNSDSLSNCLQMMKKVIANIKRLQDANYSSNQISSLITVPDRLGVATLVEIGESLILEGKRSTETRDLQSLVSILRQVGLTRTASIVEARNQLEIAATTLAKFFDLAVVSYSGAHLERFDQKYFSTANGTDEIILTDCLVLRRRSLQCLDEFLHQHQVWVFEEITAGTSRSESSLYLLTSPELFADIWGPMWATPKSTVDKEHHTDLRPILRYNLLNGYLVPWIRGPTEPDVLDNECFAHWIEAESELDNEQAFPTTNQPIKLLIGAKIRFRENQDCRLSSSIDACTNRLRKDNTFSHPAVQRAKSQLDSQSFQIGVQPHGIGLSTTMQFKARAGFLLKEAIVTQWSNDPQERNPAIVKNWYGVEISSCTYNTRRKRLARILGSSLMRHYLDFIAMSWPNVDCKERYFSSLNDRDISFERLYRDENTPTDWREAMGNAVAACLKVLSKTGHDENNNLAALWIPSTREIMKVTIRQKHQHWAGILKDTIETCSFSILTPICLEFRPRESMWQSVCQSSSNPETNSPFEQRPVLETGLIINDQAKLPRGLELNNDTNRWRIHRLESRATFDLGLSGRIVYLFHFNHRRRAMVKWETPNPLSAPIFERVRESFGRPTNYHYELGLMSCDRWPTEHISIYIISQR